jgi:NAD(P)-dependent dehydrogenase (short-subunit alcohol dehydrogenase family)
MPGIKDLRDKVVVITGAGSGIGRATAHAFAAQKSKLVIADINKERLDSVVKEIEALGAQVAAKVTDVSDKSQVEALAKFTLDTYGRVDVIHNNAGVGIGGPLEIFPLEDWEKIVGINFWSVVYGVKYFLPHMIEQRSGHIVNTSSAAGFCGMAALGAYTATKHAVVGFSDVLRAEVRRYNIGVSTICPGVINTNVVRDGKQTLLPTAKVDQGKMAAFYDKYGWPPERVAKAVIKAVKKNKSLVPVGPEAWLLWYIKRISQTAYNFYLWITVKTAW